MARTYHVTVADLATANQVKEDEALSGREALVVPVAPVAAPSVHTLLYTTRRGDTLVSIADRFGVSLDQLRRWNKIPSGIKVEPGRRLHVAEPSSTQRSTSQSRRRGVLSQGAKRGKASSTVEKASSHGESKPASRASGHNSQQKTYAKKQNQE